MQVQINQQTIELQQGDVTEQAVDAVVNAANESLLGGGGVDGAIHRAAGPQLREYNQTLGGCRTGQAVITPGFNLPARWIIHTVGPVWRGGADNEPALLASCYRNCLELAVCREIRKIAFPGISTGIYGFPKQPAAEIALSVMSEYLQWMNDIQICCFTADDADIYQSLLNQ